MTDQVVFREGLVNAIGGRWIWKGDLSTTKWTNKPMFSEDHTPPGIDIPILIEWTKNNNLPEYPSNWSENDKVLFKLTWN